MALADAVFLRFPPGVDLPDEELWRMARSFGSPDDVHIDRSRDPYVAFVYFRSFADAAGMIGASPLTINGHPIEAQPKMPAPGRALYLGNVDNAVTEAELFQLCRVYGRINYVSLGFDKGGGRLPIAFVGFRHREGVDAAIAGLDGQPLNGQPLRVEVAEKNRREVSPPESTAPRDVSPVYTTQAPTPPVPLPSIGGNVYGNRPTPTRMHAAPEHARPPRRKGSRRRREGRP